MMSGDSTSRCALARSTDQPGFKRPMIDNHHACARGIRPFLSGSEQPVCAERDRDVIAVPNLDAKECGLCDADYRKGLAIETQLAPDYIRTAGKLALPKSMTEYRARTVTTRGIVLIVENAAESGRDAEVLKESATDIQALRVTDLPARR